MNEEIFFATSTSTAPDYKLTRESQPTKAKIVAPSPSKKDEPVQGNLEKAVYGHIRAVRSLGRQTINTAEIARALSVSVSSVEHAVDRLQSKGVKKIAR